MKAFDVFIRWFVIILVNGCIIVAVLHFVDTLESDPVEVDIVSVGESVELMRTMFFDAESYSTRVQHKIGRLRREDGTMQLRKIKDVYIFLECDCSNLMEMEFRLTTGMDNKVDLTCVKCLKQHIFKIEADALIKTQPPSGGKGGTNGY